MPSSQGKVKELFSHSLRKVSAITIKHNLAKSLFMSGCDRSTHRASRFRTCVMAVAHGNFMKLRGLETEDGTKRALEMTMGNWTMVHDCGWGICA